MDEGIELSSRNVDQDTQSGGNSAEGSTDNDSQIQPDASCNTSRQGIIPSPLNLTQGSLSPTVAFEYTIFTAGKRGGVDAGDKST